MNSDEPTHWRQLFERGRPERPPGVGSAAPPPQPSPPKGVSPFGYDDGYSRACDADPARQPMSPQAITDEAAMALTLDTAEYRPWILQRGRGQPPLMLDLRRYDARSGQWLGWQVSYPHLAAVEYTGDKFLSLDFGARQFVIEGRGLLELPRFIQQGSVLALVEYSQARWPGHGDGPRISAIKRLGGEPNMI